MKFRFVPVAALFVLAIVPSLAHAQKLVIVVRHAERADAGMIAQETDPMLSGVGAARAAKLSTVLADADIKAIYATQYRRTQDTAKPLAARLNIQIQQTPASNEALAVRLKLQHPNDVVLMVGHSNTVPAIIRALGGPDVTIDDDDFGSIFFVVPATKLVTRIHY